MRNEETTKRALVIISRAIEKGYRPDELCSSCVKELVKDINEFSKQEDIGVFNFEDLESAIKYAIFMNDRGWRVSDNRCDELIQIELLAETYLTSKLGVEGIIIGEVEFVNGIQTICYEDEYGCRICRASAPDVEWLLTRRYNPNQAMFKIVGGRLVKATVNDMIERENGDIVWSDDCYSLVDKFCDSKGFVNAVIVK